MRERPSLALFLFEGAPLILFRQQGSERK